MGPRALVAPGRMSTSRPVAAFSATIRCVGVLRYISPSTTSGVVWKSVGRFAGIVGPTRASAPRRCLR